MALTRPTLQNINTNLTTFTDSLLVLNYGNVANRDIGQIYDRSLNSTSNVALIWQESTQSFKFGYTSSTGTDQGNITITGNANIQLGNLYAESISWANGTPFTSASTGAGATGQFQYNNAGVFGGASNFYYTSGNGQIIANANIDSTSTTTGTMIVTGGVGISGNANIGGNVTANSYIIGGTGIFWSNGTQFTSGGGGTGVTYTANTAPPASGNVKGDQWYNTTTDALYEYQYDGVSYYWVDVTTPSVIGSNLSNLTNTVITGNLIPAVDNTYTLGNASYRFATANISGNITVGNVIGNQFGNSTGTTATYTGNVTAGNVIAVHFGNSSGTIATYTGNVTASSIIANAAPGGNNTTSNAVGYIGLPQNSQSTGYTLVLADQGQHIYITSNANVTIPANVTLPFPIGSTINIITGSNSTANVLINTDTLYLAGIGTTGTRTLSTYAMATLVKITGNTWYIGGTGVS